MEYDKADGEAKIRKAKYIRWTNYFAMFTCAVVFIVVISIVKFGAYDATDLSHKFYKDIGVFSFCALFFIGALLLIVEYYDNRILQNVLKTIKGFSPQETYSNKTIGICVDVTHRSIAVAGRSKEGEISVRMIQADDISECIVQLLEDNIEKDKRNLSGSAAVVGGLMYGPVGAFAASLLGSDIEKQTQTIVKSIVLCIILKEINEAINLVFLSDVYIEKEKIAAISDYKKATMFKEIIDDLLGNGAATKC